MSHPKINGQYLLDLTRSQMGGYGNAFEAKDLLNYINEGKDAVWAILKATREDYIMGSSQNTDDTKDNYFADLTTTTREFVLPADLIQLKMIEVLTSGFNEVEFEQQDMASEEFKEARRSNVGSSPGGSRTTYFFDIIVLNGDNTLILAQFPETNFNLKLWYVRSIPYIDVSSPVDGVLYPYAVKIAAFAAKRAMLPLQDKAMWVAWQKEWEDDARRIEVSAQLRDISTRKVTEDFLGDR